jgi:hypothetical protein
MPKLQLCVTVEQEITRLSWQGQIVARPIPRQVRNDADALYQILSGLDHGKERFRERRRLIARLCRELRPIRKAALAREDTCDDAVMGEIDVTEDALRFLGKLFDDPPEGISLTGQTVETALAIEDAIDALKEKDDKPKEEPCASS